MQSAITTGTSAAFVSRLGPDVSAAQLVSDPGQGDMVPFGLVNVSPQTGDLQLPVTIDYHQSCPT